MVSINNNCDTPYKKYIRDYKKGFVVFEKTCDGFIVEVNTKIRMTDLKESWVDKTTYNKVGDKLIKFSEGTFYNEDSL
jgi:hypothetical protein